MSIVIYIVTGAIVGGLIVYLILKLTSLKNQVSRSDYNRIHEELQRIQLENASKISSDEVEKKYVSRDLYNALKSSNDTLAGTNARQEEIIRNQTDTVLTLTAESKEKFTRDEIVQNYRPKDSFDLVQSKLTKAETLLSEKEERINTLTNQLTEITEREKSVTDKLNLFNSELKNLQDLSRDQFKNLAFDIFEEKKNQFVKTSQTEINNLLNPFKTDLTTFKEKVEATRKEDIQDLTSLKNEIAALQKLNTQLSDDAKQLALALKSDVKLQGNWGEDRLNLVLEAEGLQKYIDYTREEAYKDEELDANRKPDFILRLPGEKHIIIDSKVTLTAYANYYNASTADDKEEFIKQHINSIYAHIDRLSEKNYQSLAGLTSPDYVFMFMPIESALTLALNKDPDIFSYAVRKKIVIVTPSTLIASLKIVKLLWKKESQVKNSQEIYRQAGALYDKFVSFMEHMDKIESGLSIAVKAHGEAMAGLKTGTKKGATIMGRMETIRLLEANTNKRIPAKHLTDIELSVTDNFEISEGPLKIDGDKITNEDNSIDTDTSV